MVTIDRLILGALAENLLAKVISVEPVQSDSNRRPVYRARIADPTGSVMFTYGEGFRSLVKYGRTLHITGRVTCYQGIVQVQVGEKWGNVRKAGGGEGLGMIDAGLLNDLSSVRRKYGIVLRRIGEQSVWEYLLVPETLAGHENAHEEAPLMLPSSIPGFRDSEKDAACRALIDATPLEEYDFCLLHDRPPISSCAAAKSAEGSTNTVITLTLFFAAILKPFCTDPLERVSQGIYNACWCSEDTIIKGLHGVRKVDQSVWNVVRQMKGQRDGGMMKEEAVGAVVHADPMCTPKALARAADISEGGSELSSTSNSDSSSSTSSMLEGPTHSSSSSSSSSASLEHLRKTSGALPVTVLSGFLGAGKTTIVNELLRNTQGLRICLIVNDMGEANVDAALIKDGGLTHAEEKMVELTNGCICCTLREDLLVEVARLAQEGRFEYLVIESSGISEPLPVAETFTFESGVLGKERLMDVACLDTMVTVVDAINVLSQLQSTDTLRRLKLASAPKDPRTLSHLLKDQIEFADIIVVTKTDLLSPDGDAIPRLKVLLAALNPTAEVVMAVKGAIDPLKIMGTRRFKMEKAEMHENWLMEARFASF
ncbi:hypothetical protein HK097_009808 [Rhizophlyctis rosea]|uniref:CobW/HypB/UreG nucleotide-binding domain-containing protein n=1 Tax=Rhizophlyctis rosea TaxID=64517 RepID=A0AAD5X066_9FUNG|nr:hypothetical protein HK097_009808 [Rhizophlyctis rosea]